MQSTLRKNKEHYEWEKMQVYVDCSSISSLSILNTSNQKACLPALNCKCNASEVEQAGKEEKRNEKQLLPRQPNNMIMTLSVPAMPVTGLSKSWMKFSILYHKNIKNF
jgi:hypothetical protein